MQFPIFEYRSPHLIWFGRGSLAKLPSAVDALGITRALIVVDANLGRAGLSQRVAALCEQARIEAAIYGGVDSEPLTRHVEEGLAIYRESRANGIVAVGGGSALDTGKAISAMSTNPGQISDYMVPRQLVSSRAPLICLPTTAGTGSEVTRFCIISDPQTRVKMLISDPRLVPDIAIDDPELTDSCPPHITASTGIDALTHAIEAYVSRKANPLSNLLALSAMRRISTCILRAFQDSSDQEARDAMMLGQLEAGLAFSNSSVCLVHGMARPLGAHFQVPHGLANSVLLAPVMEWSLKAAPCAYAEIASALGCETDGLSTEEAAQASVAAIRKLCQGLKFPTLAEAAGGAEKVRAAAPQMAKDALASGSPANNPWVPDEADIVSLYERALVSE